MPRNVRNVWFDVDIDGRVPMKGGPRAHDGGADATVYVRHRGRVTTALDIMVHADCDGKITLTLVPRDPDAAGGVVWKADGAPLSKSAVLTLTTER